MEEGVILHDESNSRFILTIDGENSVVDYQFNGDVMDIYHTYVPDKFRGQGIASKMVKKVLDYAHEHDYKVKPTCPFVAAFIKRNKDYQGLAV